MASRIKSMTDGKPAALILTFALPLMIGNVFQQLYTVVDTMVVGKALGVSALAAVGAADWMNWLMLGIGQLIAYPVLQLLQTPPEIVGNALLYLRIMYLGIPIVMSYNLFATILRSLGDGKTPLYAMIVAAVATL